MVRHPENAKQVLHSRSVCEEAKNVRLGVVGGRTMSIGFRIVIILVIFLLGGFSGRFGGYGYGCGSWRHRGYRCHPDHRRRATSHGKAVTQTGGKSDDEPSSAEPGKPFH